MPPKPTLGQQAAAELKAARAKAGSLPWDEVANIIDRCAALQPRRERAPVEPAAEQVYALYPKKVGRDEALRAISKQLKKHPLDYLLGKTNMFARAVDSWPVSYRYTQDGRDLCPLPSTWFNQGRFADDPKEWRRFGARKGAEHQHISPAEPADWRQHFPDFVDRDKPWNLLQPAQQQFIITTLQAAGHFTAEVKADAYSTRLRDA